MDVSKVKGEIAKKISNARGHLAAEDHYVQYLIAAVQVKDYKAAESNRKAMGWCERRVQHNQKQFLSSIGKFKQHGVISSKEMPEINRLMEHLRVENNARVKEVSLYTGRLKEEMKKYKQIVENEAKEARRKTKEQKKKKSESPAEFIKRILPVLHNLRKEIAAALVTYSHLMSFVMHKVHAEVRTEKKK